MLEDFLVLLEAFLVVVFFIFLDSVFAVFLVDVFTSFLFAILLPFVKHLTQIVLRIPMKTCAKFWSCLLKSEFRQLIPMLAFLLAVGILAPTYPLLASYNFPLSEIGIVLIFIDAIVDLFQSDL